MSQKVSKQQLEEHLNQLDKKALITEISRLFLLFNEVQEHYQIQYGEEAERYQLLAKYKKKIEKEFYFEGDYPDHPNISVLRKVIREFRKETKQEQDVIDLRLYLVEQAISLALEVKDIEPSFYTVIEQEFTEALFLIEEKMLHIEFYEQAHAVVFKTKDMSWYFHNTLKNVYIEVYGQNTVK